MALLNGGQACLRQLEVGLGRADARLCGRQDVVALLDIEDDILDRAVEDKICSYQLFSRTTFLGPGAAKVEQVVARFYLRKKGFVADDQRLAGKLKWQFQVTAFAFC